MDVIFQPSYFRRRAFANFRSSLSPFMKATGRSGSKKNGDGKDNGSDNEKGCGSGSGCGNDSGDEKSNVSTGCFMPN